MHKKLYHHRTDGGAEYLTDRWTRNPDGSKEGVFKNAKIIIRIDGDITKDAEITLADELFTHNAELSGGEAVRSDVLFGVSVAGVDGFRSVPKVNADEDMVRVTLDMPKHTWRKLQKLLPPNAEVSR